jgi:gluconokinase
MISQQPLQVEHRRPWLLEIEDDIRRAIDLNREIVMTCSALKASYRKKLASLGRVQLVWIEVSRSMLEQRLKERAGHYMKPEMLLSQIEAFEVIHPEENIITIDGNPPINAVVSELMIKAIQRFLSTEISWWKRCIE